MDPRFVAKAKELTHPSLANRIEYLTGVVEHYDVSFWVPNCQKGTCEEKGKTLDNFRRLKWHRSTLPSLGLCCSTQLTLMRSRRPSTVPSSQAQGLLSSTPTDDWVQSLPQWFRVCLFFSSRKFCRGINFSWLLWLFVVVCSFVSSRKFPAGERTSKRRKSNDRAAIREIFEAVWLLRHYRRYGWW